MNLLRISPLLPLAIGSFLPLAANEYKFEEIVINGLESDFDYEVSEKETQLFDVLMIENLKKNIKHQ